MKKILIALVATTAFSAMALTMSDTADARWGYAGYRGVGYHGGYRLRYPGFAYRGYGYRVGYRGYGYSYPGYAYPGYGYGGNNVGYGYLGYGYSVGYAGYGYPVYDIGAAIVVAPAYYYYPAYYYGFSGCGC